MDIQTYKIIECGSVSGLSRIVNDCIKDGFQPFGEPFDRGTVICQVMVKNKDHPPAPSSKMDSSYPVGLHDYIVNQECPNCALKFTIEIKYHDAD